MNDYFSDREDGPRARTEQVISTAVCVIDVDQVDYLFHRLFAMISSLIKEKGLRMRNNPGRQALVVEMLAG